MIRLRSTLLLALLVLLPLDQAGASSEDPVRCLLGVTEGVPGRIEQVMEQAREAGANSVRVIRPIGLVSSIH